MRLAIQVVYNLTLRSLIKVLVLHHLLEEADQLQRCKVLEIVFQQLQHNLFKQNKIKAILTLNLCKTVAIVSLYLVQKYKCMKVILRILRIETVKYFICPLSNKFFASLEQLHTCKQRGRAYSLILVHYCLLYIVFFCCCC